MFGGCRLTVTSFGGSAIDKLVSAARARWRSSAIALRGKPKMENDGTPGDRAHCPSTVRASMPSTATVCGRASVNMSAAGMPEVWLSKP